jgi:hypothetical protein
MKYTKLLSPSIREQLALEKSLISRQYQTYLMNRFSTGIARGAAAVAGTK